MMQIVVRYLAVAALMFWLGGFTFYASVVVPVGTMVLGSGLRQGFITREVTIWLNVSAAIALALLLLELLVARDSRRWRFWLRLTLWLVMAGVQVMLFWLHADMDQYVDPEARIVLEYADFRWRHRLYLWLHTGQWLVGLFYIGFLLTAWRAADRETTG